MKVEMPEAGIVVINEGDFVISEDGQGFYVVGYGPEIAPVMSSAGLLPHEQGDDEPTNDDLAEDPVRYLSGGNRMSISDSAERALERVYSEIWGDLTSDSIGDVNLLRESIRDMIRDGMGRQAVYILAGGIKKGFKEGLYYGVPLAYIFKGFTEGHIQQESDAWAQSYRSF